MSDRHFRPALTDFPDTRQEAEKIVERILELERASHHDETEPASREIASIMALRWARRLVRSLAGWAISHRIGIAISETAGWPWPVGDNQSANEANDARHEEIGSDYDFSDPILNRQILVELLRKGPVGIPTKLANEAAYALAALEFGEVHDLVKPSRRRQHGAGYKLARLRFMALKHVAFLRGLGWAKSDAQSLVGNAYGVSDETIDVWGARLSNDMPEQHIVVGVEMARRLGEAVFKRQYALHSSEQDECFVSLHIDLFGEPGIRQSGAEYKGLLETLKGA